MTTGAALDVSRAPAEFRAAALLVSRMPTELRRELGKAVRREVVPVAVRAYSQAPGASSTGNRLPYVLARSAKVTARSGVVTGLRFGSTRVMPGARRTPHPVTLNDLARPIEFGATGDKERTYTRRNRGGSGSHTVKRHTMTAYAPKRDRGRFIWPTTYTVVAPRVLAVWTAVVVRFAGGAE